MGILKLQEIQIPDFGLETPFNDNTWNIKEWDFYKNANKSNQYAWDIRSSAHSYKIDFNIITNLVIREELKFCMYKIYSKNISLRTFSEKFDHLKHYIAFFNQKNYKTITETDISEFEIYLKNNGIKLITSNGNRVFATTDEIKPTEKRNRFITFLIQCIKWVDEYLLEDSTVDVYDRDIWYSNDMPIIDENLDSNRKIDFSGIKNKEFKQHLKDFCKNRLSVVTYETTSCHQRAICVFYSWLDDNHKEIEHLNQLNRIIIEEYFIWLRTQSGFSQHHLNDCILKLKQFFEIADLLELQNMPSFDLILNTDYAFKSEKEPKFFTDDELKSIISVIPKMKPLYGRILYCLITLGCRVNEVLRLKIEQVKKYPDGKYYLLLRQTKTKVEYEKPIPDSTAKILLSEIKLNQKKYGQNATYVFSREKDDKPISLVTLSRNIHKTLIINNIKDRDGNPLHCNTHRLRSTLATNLLKGGTEAKAVGRLLGQKNIQSLGYYADITKEEAKEQLQARIEKDELLISNIGKLDDKVLTEYENPIALCNGWCVKSPTLGTCAKANHCLECNMFIPTIAYLSHYEKQLHDIEATIAVAKANNMEVLLNKSLKTKESLENIIHKIRERRNANE